MFDFKIEKELTCKVEGSGKFIAKKGAMIAYQGNFKFDKMLLGPDNGGGMLGALVGFAKRSVTGENISLMTVEGSGAIYLAENAYHLTVLELENEEICVESENLLAFSAELRYDVRFVGVGVLSQKGLATSYLSGTGKVVIKTDGNPIILETPCVVDPDAVVSWTGSRDPHVKTDVSWKTFVGQTSGESYQLDFNFPGEQVIVQPSERLSSLHIGLD
jgi:uncharacterized protein (AIM24 family)